MDRPPAAGDQRLVFLYDGLKEQMFFGATIAFCKRKLSYDAIEMILPWLKWPRVVLMLVRAELPS